MSVNNFLCQFKSDCHQTSSVIALATGDKVIKFWKVKVKVQGRRGGMRSTDPFYFKHLKVWFSPFT